MKKLWFIPLGMALLSMPVNGQRNVQLQAADRLFVEGQEMYALKNFNGCIDKLTAYKLHAKDADLIQEADFLLACSADEQGTADAEQLLKDYLENYPDTRHVDEVSFRIGSLHFGRGEYEKAAYWFNRADVDMLGTTQQEACTYRLGYSLLQTGDRQKARDYFGRVSQFGSTYREASTYYMAHIDYADGKYDRALEEFSKLRESAEFKKPSRYHIAQILFIQNKYQRAITEGESLVTDYPDDADNAEIYGLLGNSYYHQGNSERAIDRLSKYISLAKSPLRSNRYLLGISYYNKGNYNNAVNELSKTVGTDDALTQNAYLYLGQSYLKLGDKNNARMAFEQAAASNADKMVKESAMYNHAVLIHETGFNGFGESVKVFENFLNEFPQSRYADKVNDYLVEMYMTTRNYASALASINKIKQPATKIMEAKQEILFRLGTEAFADTQLDKASGYFTQAINLGNYKPEAKSNAYFWRGECEYRNGNYAKAEDDYRSYLNTTQLKSGDTYSLAHYNLGYCAFKGKNYTTALSRFNEYIALETNRKAASLADAYNRAGDCQFENRLFSQATENYAKAKEILPSAGDYSTYQRGFVLGLQKDYKGKIAAMDELIRSYPNSSYVADALFEEGRSYVLLDDYTNAAKSFNQLMERFPKNSLAAKAGVQLGLLYFNDNQPQKSVQAYKKVISDYPGSDEAKVALQDLKSVYVELNDVNGYASYANSIGGSVKLDVSEQDSLTYLAAEKLYMKGDKEAAKSSLRNYAEKYPQGAFSSNVQYYLGKMAFSEKDYDAAKYHFGNVLKSGDMKFVEDATARMAEITYMNKDYAAAKGYFLSLQNVAASEENRTAANVGLMRCALLTNDHKEALASSERLLKEAKLSPEVEREARYVRAKAYIAGNESSKALADLKKLSEDTRSVEGAEAKYLLAQYYYDTKKDKEAEQVLTDFINKGTPHQYWLARGFIVLSDIYIRQGDDFQARQYLTSLQQNYKADDDIAGMIESRLSKLKK